MSDSNLIMDKIREELEKGLPSKRKILSYLLDLLKKDKYPSLSDFDFYDIVGYTYELNLNYKLNLELSFTDSTILTHCKRLNCNFLATFDKHFKGLISSNLS